LPTERVQIRTGELNSWFLAEHLVDTPLVHTQGVDFDAG
jgi:hypothetical protein